MPTTALPAGRADGAVPFVLKVGTLGHRGDAAMPTDAAVADALVRAIEVVVPGAPPHVALCAVSSIAEGAESAIARAVLATREASLEVVLPMDPATYSADFATPASKAEFYDLLSKATVQVIETGDGTAADAFVRAARQVVERSDVVIAIWDLEPSRGDDGNAQTVGYALQRGVPVIVVPTGGGPLVVDTGVGRLNAVFAATGACRDEALEAPPAVSGSVQVTREMLVELAAFNLSSEHQLRGYVDSLGEMVRREADRVRDTGRPAETLDDMAAWFLPFMERADRLAIRLERRYNHLVTAEFVFAALAVLVGAGAYLFAPGARWTVALELIAIGGIATVVVYGRRSRIRARWLSSRFLAERMRSALFLRAAGLRTHVERGLEGVGVATRSDDWLKRACAFAWDAAPDDAPALDVVDVRNLLAAVWIRPQLEYHQRKGARHHRAHRRLSNASLALFALTAVAAVLGIVSLPSGAVKSLVLLSIALPAFGSALVGIDAQRQHQRNASASARTADQLAEVLGGMDAEPTLQGLQRVALAADGILAEEGREWFSVMRVHDLEWG